MSGGRSFYRVHPIRYASAEAQEEISVRITQAVAKDSTPVDAKPEGTYFVFPVEGTHFIVEVENRVSHFPVLIWFLITGIVLLLTAAAIVYRKKANLIAMRKNQL